MKVFLFALFLSLNAQAEDSVHLLGIGDSQTGATWSKSYFGNFLQTCLKEKMQKRFVTYARGGTAPIHWMTNSGLDKIETIQRDNDNNHLNIGNLDQVPLSKKRIKDMLEAHNPEKMFVFFGDNLLSVEAPLIVKQFKNMANAIQAAGITPENCFFLTPTYEMEVKDKRNVPGKNLVNTLKVNKAIKEGVGSTCQVIDGLELMTNSKLLLHAETNNPLLKRVLVPELVGCGGTAANDNIHLCGEAAKELANKVCQILSGNQ